MEKNGEGDFEIEKEIRNWPKGSVVIMTNFLHIDCINACSGHIRDKNSRHAERLVPCMVQLVTEPMSTVMILDLNLIDTWNLMCDINVGKLISNHNAIRFNISMVRRLTKTFCTVTFNFKQRNFSKMREWVKTSKAKLCSFIVRLGDNLELHIKEAQLACIPQVRKGTEKAKRMSV